MGFAVEVKIKSHSLLRLIEGNDYADFRRIVLDLYRYRQEQSQTRNVPQRDCSDEYLVSVKSNSWNKMHYSPLLPFSPYWERDCGFVWIF